MKRKKLTAEDKAFWFDGWGLINNFMTLIIGGRGIGKTYSVLKGSLRDKVKILYVRRTGTELDISCTKEFNPYKALNSDLGVDIRISAITKSTYAIIEYEEDIPIRHIGIAGSLSTFGNLRGADFTDIEMIVFDEFINTGMFSMKKEAYAFFNMIETVNRNRELKGIPSIKVVLLANSNSLDSDILVTFKLTDIIRRMQQKKEGFFEDKQRGVSVHLPLDSPVSEAKKETALYKLTKGTDFYDMAINNEFTDNFDVVEEVDYRRVKPVVMYGDLTVYKDKQARFLYISNRKADCQSYDATTMHDFLLIYKSYINTYKRKNLIKYHDYDIKLKLDKLLSNKI